MDTTEQKSTSHTTITELDHYDEDGFFRISETKTDPEVMKKALESVGEMAGSLPLPSQQAIWDMLPLNAEQRIELLKLIS